MSQANCSNNLLRQGCTSSWGQGVLRRRGKLNTAPKANNVLYHHIYNYPRYRYSDPFRYKSNDPMLALENTSN